MVTISVKKICKEHLITISKLVMKIYIMFSSHCSSDMAIATYGINNPDPDCSIPIQSDQ